jgi:hypothetical protein
MVVTSRAFRTEAFHHATEYRPPSNAIYVYSAGIEERNLHLQAWKAHVDNLPTLEIHEGDGIITYSGALNGSARLRSQNEFREMFAGLNDRTILLDITGLSASAWAPMIRNAFQLRADIRILYAEPEHYTPSEKLVESGGWSELSESRAGVSPLPTFANLSATSPDQFLLVPLLGFEGARFRYVYEQIQPLGGRIVPVIGVPGFRLEYPFYAYHGNKAVLSETQSWRRIRYVPADCPYSLLQELSTLSGQYPDDRLVIAPIGTKPHALGAVLFALLNPDRVELVYDHPKKKKGRTSGTGKLLSYDITILYSGAS